MKYDSGILFSFDIKILGSFKIRHKPSIKIRQDNGTVDPILNTASNITNALVHERDHHTYQGPRYTSKVEQHAIGVQKNHPSWPKTTNEFKLLINTYEKKFNR